MAKNDLQPIQFPTLDWNSGALAAPLKELSAYAAREIEEAVAWYYSARQVRRYFCRFFRLTAIILTAFAGLLPLVNEIIAAQPEPASSNIAAPATDGLRTNLGLSSTAVNPQQARVRREIHPLWSAVALAVAATLILLDRFYGSTNGWVRYISAAQQLTAILDQYRLNLERQKISWANGEPTQDQAAASISIIQQSLAEARGVVGDETKVWASEFADILKELDDQMKIVSKDRQEASIEVSVSNGEQCANGWVLTVGSHVPEKCLGKNAAIKVVPGLQIIKASGEINGRVVQAAQSCKAGSGEIVKVTMTLA